MFAAHTTISCVLLVAGLYYFTLIDTAEGKVAWKCKECRPNGNGGCIDDPPLNFCRWNETRNICNQRVCAKGPGERCGGPKEIFGRCGVGMWCQQQREDRSSRCHGCYGDSSNECYHEED
ncbi:neuroparsin-A-like [Atheta coriaria]|uniref:neuroparsin-A-like n=1 Tax=Dalotia coriaria TaxID=877792 RepID=UPI0031F3F59D